MAETPGQVPGAEAPLYVLLLQEREARKNQGVSRGPEKALHRQEPSVNGQDFPWGHNTGQRKDTGYKGIVHRTQVSRECAWQQWAFNKVKEMG